MKDLFSSFKPAAALVHTVRIEFDGGTPCNIPRLGYGIGYGSYRIDDLPIVRLDHREPMSANTAELLTLACAVESLVINPAETRLMIFGDSQIALKWARIGAGQVDTRRKKAGAISKGASEPFKLAIQRLAKAIAPFADVEATWQPRLKSVAVFGH